MLYFRLSPKASLGLFLARWLSLFMISICVILIYFYIQHSSPCFFSTDVRSLKKTQSHNYFQLKLVGKQLVTLTLIVKK
jgi:hypothetical protein